MFEATILLALSNLPRDHVLGSLLLFRLCYYLVPFVLALAMLALRDPRPPPATREVFGTDEGIEIASDDEP